MTKQEIYQIVHNELRSLKRYDERILSTKMDKYKKMKDDLDRCNPNYDKNILRRYRRFIWKDIYKILGEYGSTTNWQKKYDYIYKWFDKDIAHWLLWYSMMNNDTIVYYEDSIVNNIWKTYRKIGFSSDIAAIRYTKRLVRKLVFHERRHKIQNWYRNNFKDSIILGPPSPISTNEICEYDADYWAMSQIRYQYGPEALHI